MTDVTTLLDQLRLAVGEVDAVAAVTMKWFDDEDWSDADPLLVERAGFMLGVIARSAAFAASKLDGFHAAVADTQPAPAGERWDGEGTASAPGDKPAMSAQDAEIVRRLRERCAAKFNRPVDYPFFLATYLDGEDPDAALLRLFKRNKQVIDRTDDDVIAAMVPFALEHEKPTGSRR